MFTLVHRVSSGGSSTRPMRTHLTRQVACMHSFGTLLRGTCQDSEVSVALRIGAMTLLTQSDLSIEVDVTVLPAMLSALSIRSGLAMRGAPAVT